MGGGMLSDAIDGSDLEIGSKSSESGDFDERLRRLHQLHQDDIFTEEEYQKEKAYIIDDL